MSAALPACRVAPGEWRIRQATATDLAPLNFFFDTFLRRDYFLRRGQLADMLADAYHRVYIAELNSVLIGIAVTTRGSQLINVLIHPAYRGLGFGRALVEHTGVRFVRAKLDMHTGDPRGFYRALGFAATGKRNAKGNVELMRRRTGCPGSAEGNRAYSTPKNRRTSLDDQCK